MKPAWMQYKACRIIGYGVKKKNIYTLINLNQLAQNNSANKRQCIEETSTAS